MIGVVRYLLAVLSTCAARTVVQLRHDSDLAGLVPTSGYIDRVTVRTRLACATRCGRKSDCQSLFYTSTTGACQLHSSLFDVDSPGLVAESATVYYHIRACEPGPLVASLPDFQLTASSFRSAAYAPERGRLDDTSFWKANKALPDEYIQVDLGSPMSVTAVVTQGETDMWTMSYTVLTSTDCINYAPLLDTIGSPQEFPGNNDTTSHVTTSFAGPLEARCVRISPVTWYAWPALRIELLGCGM